VSVPPIPGTGLDVDQLKADPCAALTLDQLHDIGFVGGQQQVGVWIDGATLHYLYAERARGHSGGGNHFDPITIGTCTIDLGTRDDTLITVDVHIGYSSDNSAGPWKKDARGAAQKVAAFVIASLRAR
jgi:hypothetical protein